MCGRLNIADQAGVEWLMEALGLPMFDLAPRFNVSPGAQLYAIFRSSHTMTTAPMVWGLLPSWAKPTMRPLINARAETIWEKPSFKNAIKRHRVALPVNGYYEWKRSGNSKQAFYISANDPAMALAGIYDLSQAGEMHCCIITTQATDPNMLKFHQREPVMLNATQARTWLQNDDSRQLDQLMDSQHRSTDFVRIRPVSNYVNNARNDGPKCMHSASESG